jgi:DNA primase
MTSGGGEQPDRASLTNLDQPLFDGADATKRDLVDYLDAVADDIIPELADRPLSVIRVLRGQAPFMQKNVPSYTPSWVVRERRSCSGSRSTAAVSAGRTWCAVTPSGSGNNIT